MTGAPVIACPACHEAFPITGDYDVPQGDNPVIPRDVARLWRAFTTIIAESLDGEDLGMAAFTLVANTGLLRRAVPGLLDHIAECDGDDG